MPVDRGLATDLADTLSAMYADAEARLAAQIALQLRAGLDTPDWAASRLAALGRLQRWTRTTLTRLGEATGPAAEQALVLAYARGSTSGLAEMRRLQLDPAERAAIGNRVEAVARMRRLAEARSAALGRELTEIRHALPGVDAVQRLAFGLTSRLQGTHLRVLRWAEDAYRSVIAEAAAPGVLLGMDTRRRAAQRAWDRFLDRGITGFVDRSGRAWALSSYVEMASRTTVAQAAVEAHLDRLGDVGLDLVVVSDAPQECVRCRPWEGKILARSGPGGRRTVEMEHATDDGRTVRVEVAGSVDEAVSAGLMHPNCRHSLSGYLPGVTHVPTNTEDPDGDKARQEQRRIEREIRKWKTRETAAIDPEAQRRAQAKVRAWQGRMREHLADHPELRRLRYREQPGAGNIGQRGTPPTAGPTRPTEPGSTGPTPSAQAPASQPLASSATTGGLPQRRRSAPPPATGRLSDMLDADRSSAEVRETILDQFGEVINGEYAGLHVQADFVDLYDFGPDDTEGLLIRMGIHNDGGVQVGESYRGFYRDSDGDLVAVHALLTLRRDVRGRGFATAFNARLEAWYREQGISRIEVHANIDVGGYTWASHGYDWADEESAQSILGLLGQTAQVYTDRALILYEQAKLAAAAEAATMREIADMAARQADQARDLVTRAGELPFGSDGYPTPYEISQIGRTSGVDTWLGRDAMLGSSWQGVKWL